MHRVITLGNLGIDGSAFARTKPLVLLAYLAAEGPQARRRLAALFWPSSADPLNQLSLTLSRLGRDLPGSFRATARTVEARVSCDAVELRAALTRGDVEGAVELYRGEFLAGASVRSVSDELREWLDDTRDGLARALQRGLLERAAHAGAKGERAVVTGLVRRALAVRDASLFDVDDLLFAHDVLAVARDPAASRLRADAEDLGLEVAAPGGRLGATGAPRADEAEADGPGVARHPRAARRELVGRSRELLRLHDLLVTRARRLVTVTGPGGVGKSLLASVAAADAAASGAFPGGLVRVACDGLAAARDVLGAVLVDLGASAPAAGSAVRTVARALEARGRTLLLLDDLDRHVPDAAWLDELLEAAPGVCVLATAHRPLGWASEHVLPLAGLSASGAAAGEVGELFLEVARRADATFELEPADVPHVAELGRLTAGNPLAIELAAAWAAVMPVAEIAAEVAGGVEILATEARDVPARHRSILAVFQRGWELIGEEERGQMSRLSVLRGSFDRAAAVAVGGIGLRDLARLCRMSLLYRPAAGRFECQPTFRRWIRDRAAERQGEHAAARERHADHFLAVATAASRALDTSEGGRWLERLDIERSDLLEAIGWSWESGDVARLLALLRALGQYWVRRGQLDAALPWYERAASVEPPPGSEEDLAAVLRVYAYSLVVTGDLESPGPLLQRALEAARSASSPDEEARVANGLGVLAVFRQELDSGSEWYQRALALAREAGTHDLVPFVLNNLGDVHLFRGRLEQAGACYREAIARLRALGNLQMLSNVLGSLGVVAVREGRLREAQVALRESLELVRELGIAFSVSTVLDQYAALLTASGEARTAGRLWGAADALRRRLGAPLEWFAAEERTRWQGAAAYLVGAEALDAAIGAGGALTADAALDLALAGGSRLARPGPGGAPAASRDRDLAPSPPT